MRWKCPVCGNSENLDESLRSICDHEIQSDEIEKYRVEPDVDESYGKGNRDDSWKTRPVSNSMKKIKATFTVLQVICALVVVRDIFVPGPAFAVPAAFGSILMLLGFEGLVTKEVATRFNLISKDKNKVFFCLMIITYFLLSALLFQHSLSLWRKP